MKNQQLSKIITTFNSILTTTLDYKTKYTECIKENGPSFQLQLLLSKTKDKENLFSEIEQYADTLNNNSKIFYLSLLLFFNPNPKYTNKILKECLSNNTIEIETKYFILYQIIAIGFPNPKIVNAETNLLKKELYFRIIQQYKELLGNSLNPIPQEQRNEKLIFLVTAQFLSLNHGPTKTALDRCETLQNLGYEVILINTAELLSHHKAIPFFDMRQGNYLEEYSNTNSINYYEKNIPFFQCSNSMPNINEMVNIFLIINEYKPQMILSIGSYNVTADLASALVPVGMIATVPSNLPITACQFHITGKQITEQDINNVKQFGFSKKNLIQSRFTSSFKKQTTNLTRTQLNLPEDKFILALIGGRLTYEATPEFLDAILTTVEFNTHIVFIGQYNNYDEITKTHSLLKENSTNLGHQSDVLAVLECCDLYLNPPRTGGGTSAVEALSKGVPVISYKSGDVYLSVGDTFGVDSQEEYIDKIKQYATDKAFYEQQSKKAVERTKILTDTNKELNDLLNTLQSHELFF